MVWQVQGISHTSDSRIEPRPVFGIRQVLAHSYYTTKLCHPDKHLSTITIHAGSHRDTIIVVVVVVVVVVELDICQQ